MLSSNPPSIIARVFIVTPNRSPPQAQRYTIPHINQEAHVPLSLEMQQAGSNLRPVMILSADGQLLTSSQTTNPYPSYAATKCVINPSAVLVLKQPLPNNGRSFVILEYPAQIPVAGSFPTFPSCFNVSQPMVTLSFLPAISTNPLATTVMV